MKRKLGGKKGNINRDPLRKIVGHEQVSIGVYDTVGELFVTRERLECGHLVRPTEDIFGETNASSRRCRGCGDEQEPTDA